ncbi:hypothetical protein [Halobaculum sp. EA56]
MSDRPTPGRAAGAAAAVHGTAADRDERPAHVDRRRGGALR